MIERECSPKNKSHSHCLQVALNQVTSVGLIPPLQSLTEVNFHNLLLYILRVLPLS